MWNFAKVRDRRFRASELLQDAASRGVGQRGERRIELGTYLLNHMVQ